MEVIFILLGVSLLIAVFFLVMFILNIRKGQYDDTYSPSVRILFDDMNTKDHKKDNTKLKTN